MSTKIALKAAKTALDREEFDLAIERAQDVLASDAQNYFATLFLGRAFEKKGELETAAQNYTSAANLKPDDSQAWLGLCSIYESQESRKLDDYRHSAVRAAEALGSAGDLHRSQSIINKLVDFTRRHGSREQIKGVLMVMLPESGIYSFLEGRLPHPSHTFKSLAELVEADEIERIKQEITERRTRIGARVNQVTIDVKRKVFGESELESIYDGVINWSTDDDVRRLYEEKLLERAHALLEVLPSDEKAHNQHRTLTLAEGMVTIHHSFPLAWNLVLDSRDVEDLRDLDVNILREYVALFPSAGRSKVLKAWLSSDLSPFPAPLSDHGSTNEDLPGQESLSPEDRLLLITEGLLDIESSAFAYRLVSEFFLHLEEYSSAVDAARAGLRNLTTQSQNLGMSFENTKDALNSVLGSALVHYQSPRHHAEARTLFENIIARKHRFTPALIGLGLIYEELEDYKGAINLFSQALREDQDNVRVGTELAWCMAQDGHYTQALAEFEDFLGIIKPDNPQTRDLMAQTLYRIGICLWERDTSKTARRDRSGAYARFLAAIKTNVNFAPAYTSLGFYYQDYGKDKRRARQCFQKAFELSSAEVVAAQRLAEFFAEQCDWDIVEVIARRVVDSGHAWLHPGSKKREISWPFSALGVVQMNKQEYQKAVVSFLAALRITPNDYRSLVGLGESYHNSGRYNSALRTFNHALQLHAEGVTIKDETWFAEYMLANVYRELGDHEEATTRLYKVREARPTEVGVLISLLQAVVERSVACIHSGLFGEAIRNAKDSMKIAHTIARQNPEAFNLWKAVGDACSIWSWVQSMETEFPIEDASALLAIATNDETYQQLSSVGQITRNLLAGNDSNAEGSECGLPKSYMTAILCYEHAIHSCSDDIHAQAVAWYNLGWAEQRAHVFSGFKAGKKFLRGAVRCFKRAIELEAGNAEFWNALGVVTTMLSPKVAQHSFVRSLHLNELNAKVWGNLGVLYLFQEDHELARQAFARSQSVDPNYAQAWVGEGLVALSAGLAKEAFQLFAHGFEISDSASVMVKRQYALSSFDHLKTTASFGDRLTDLLPPMFALYQLREQVPQDLTYRHLEALILERVGDYSIATGMLVDLCASVEAEYEASEAVSALRRFAIAKSDLSRIQLASADFQAAIDNAETALDLSSDAESSGFDGEIRQKLRLSSHITASLASHHTKALQDSISMFRAALIESENDLATVCSLVQVLWIHGGENEKSVAREQLFECVGRNPEHIGAVTLLGAMAVLDNDDESARAIMDDLRLLKTKRDSDMAATVDIDHLLPAIATLTTAARARKDPEDMLLLQAQTSIIFQADNHHAWSRLANVSGDLMAACMALRAASASIPCTAETAADELASALAGVGSVGDMQRALALAPWSANIWQGLEECL